MASLLLATVTQGRSGVRYRVQVSGDLVHRETLPNAAEIPAGESFEDTSPAGHTRRFYRALLP